MVEFPESHVDVLKDITFTMDQLIKRWNQELAKKWSPYVQQHLKDLMQIKDTIPVGTFPHTQEYADMLDEFIVDNTECLTKRLQDEAKNANLIEAISYEKALIEKSILERLINGVEAVEGQEEVLDEEGNVVQEYIASVDAIEPLAPTVVVNTENGEEEIDNPAYVEAVAALEGVNAIIDAIDAYGIDHPVKEILTLRGAL